jgi:hypothetical protein
LATGDWVPTAENTWFPPYEWTPCCCPQCGHNIGWLFTPPPPTPPAQQQKQQPAPQQLAQQDAGKAAQLEPFFGLRIDALVAQDRMLFTYMDGWRYPLGAGGAWTSTTLPVAREHLQQFVQTDAGCLDWAQANRDLMRHVGSVVPDAHCLDEPRDELLPAAVGSLDGPLEQCAEVQLLGWIEDVQRYRVRARGGPAFGCPPIHARPESLRLAEGTTVLAVGLLAAPALNGSFGVVESWDATKGRYTVRVAGRSKLLGLKPDNCRVAHLPVLGSADGISDGRLVDPPTPVQAVARMARAAAQATAQADAEAQASNYFS